MFGIETSKSDDFTHVAELGHIAIFSEEFSSRKVANALNRREQIAVFFEFGMLVNMVLNLSFDLFNLLVEKGNMRLQVFNNSCDGLCGMFTSVQAVALAGPRLKLPNGARACVIRSRLAVVVSINWTVVCNKNQR